MPRSGPCSTKTSASMILLDTHALVWLTEGEERLGPDAQALIASRHPVHYSAVSILELSIKSLQGKLRMPDGLCVILDEVGLRQLPWIGEHADALREFPELARHDPFDRALMAQAAAEHLMFLTPDRRLLALDRPWIVDAAL